jgi:hypothetical protein
LRASRLIDGCAVLFVVDHSQPFALHLGHGRCAANYAETVVDEPDQVVEVAGAVFAVAEPGADFLGWLLVLSCDHT